MFSSLSTKFSNSMQLFRQSWSVLQQDKKLLILPAISGTLLFLLVGIGVGALVVVIASKPEFQNSRGSSQNAAAELRESMGMLWYVAIGAIYFVTHFVMTFFQTALMACIMERLDGRTPSLRAGLALACTRIPQLLAWSLLTATVGVVLNALKEKAGWIGRLFLGGIEAVWNIATFFVVPVLVVEGVGPITAVKRSATVVRRQWGEALITQFGFSMITGLMALVSALILIGGGTAISIATSSFVPGVVCFLLWVAFALALSLVSSVMRSILIAATYRMAFAGDTNTGPFRPEQLQGLFARKGSKR
jgi:hypothetical protein